MKGKKLLAMLLAVMMLVPLFAGVGAASAEEVSGADYPTVFVHGLLGWGDEDSINKLVPYWGMTAGDMHAYMNGLGYNTYVASVGPVSSAWDRCCELYAQLAGTKVDYGQAHSDKCSAQFDDLGYELHHERYGRDYTGNALIDENWGPIYENGKVVGWYDTKVNLVGHSSAAPPSLNSSSFWPRVTRQSASGVCSRQSFTAATGMTTSPRCSGATIRASIS